MDLALLALALAGNVAVIVWAYRRHDWHHDGDLDWHDDVDDTEAP